MPQLAAFIFDMDGTLVDSMPYHVQAWMELLAERRVQARSGDFLRQTSGKTNRQILREVFGDHLPEAEIATSIERKEALYRARYRPHLRPIDGLIDFLNEAELLGIPMAVATSAGKANRDFVLKGLGMEPYFSAVVGVEEIQEGKPHPEIFLKAAARLEVAPGRCLAFEDALTGIEAATRAGMKAVALATSVDAREFERLPAVIRVAKDFASLRPQELLAAMENR